MNQFFDDDTYKAKRVLLWLGAEVGIIGVFLLIVLFAVAK